MTSPASPIHQRAQVDRIRARLGKIGAAATSGVAEPDRPQLRLVPVAVDLSEGTFPCGAHTRVLDSARRVKVGVRNQPLTALLGWQPGTLGTVLVDGWLLLTQEASHIAIPRGRNGSHAGYSVSRSTELVALPPAVCTQLKVVPGDSLLVAALPAHRALVITNPNQLIQLAPGHIRRALTTTPDERTPHD